MQCVAHCGANGTVKIWNTAICAVMPSFWFVFEATQRFLYTNAKDSARESNIILKCFKVIQSILDVHQSITLRVSFLHLMEPIQKPPLLAKNRPCPKYVSLSQSPSLP